MKYKIEKNTVQETLIVPFIPESYARVVSEPISGRDGGTPDRPDRL